MVIINACICGCVCKQSLGIKLLFSVSIKSCIAGHQQLQGIQRVLDPPDARVQTGTTGVHGKRWITPFKLTWSRQ